MNSNKYFTHVLMPIVTFTLGFAIFNSVKDHFEMQEHHEFFTSMTKFANTGARFTATDGLELCDAINRLKLNYEPEQNDLLDCNRFDK